MNYKYTNPMHLYEISILGNDIFYHTDTVKATDFAAALALTTELMAKLQRNTIEQLRIAQIQELR